MRPSRDWPTSIALRTGMTGIPSERAALLGQPLRAAHVGRRTVELAVGDLRQALASAADANGPLDVAVERGQLFVRQRPVGLEPVASFAEVVLRETQRDRVPVGAAPAQDANAIDADAVRRLQTRCGGRCRRDRTAAAVRRSCRAAGTDTATDARQTGADGTSSPASSSTTDAPASVSSFAAKPPAGPEPMTQTSTAGA